MRTVLDKKFLWLFVSGCAASLGFAPYYLLVFFAMSISVLMLYTVNAESYKESFLMGWVFGGGYFLAGLYWVTYPLLFYFLDTFWWLAPIAVLVAPCLLGLYVGLCCLIMYRLKRLGPIAFAVCFICVWVFIEFLRIKFLTGFPWLIAGYSLMEWPKAIQSASIFGLLGLSFVVLSISVVPFILIVSQNRTRKIQACIVLIGIVIANMIYGACILNRHGTIFSEYKVKIIQPNIDGVVTRANMDSSAATIIDLARLVPLPSLQSSALAYSNSGFERSARESEFVSHNPLNTNEGNSNKLLYVLLPEGALSSFTSKTFAELIKTSVPEHGYLLSGGDRKEYSGGILQAWNSMFVFDRRGQVLDMYDKTHLVPFGEYMPMRSLLPDSLHAVVAYAGVFPDFSQGAGHRAIKVTDKISFCPMICYESLFSNSVSDADLLINFTTDMWYRNSTGPYQHFDMSRLRAVEYGIPFIRVASTGISGIIDPYGRVLAQLPLGERGVLEERIPMRRDGGTSYARMGDSLALMIIGFVFIAAIYFGLPRGVISHRVN